MVKQKKKVLPPIFISSVVDRYQDRPIMDRVNQLKKQLKEEKLQDKEFYQSIKEKIATGQQ